MEIDQWRLYLHVANPGLISVPAESEWQNFGELLEAQKTSDKAITVSSSGLSSATAISMQALEAQADINYRQIVYDGGNPAVISTVAGETQFTAATASEQVDMIRAQRLRPLAVVADKSLDLEGFGTVPPVTDWLPDVASAPNYFGIFIPADAADEVLDAMDKVWSDRIASSDVMRKFAAERGELFNATYGEEAQEAAQPYLSINAWQQYESGAAPNDPLQFDIPKP